MDEFIIKTENNMDTIAPTNRATIYTTNVNYFSDLIFSPIIEEGIALKDKEDNFELFDEHNIRRTKDYFNILNSYKKIDEQYFEELEKEKNMIIYVIKKLLWITESKKDIANLRKLKEVSDVMCMTVWYIKGDWVIGTLWSIILLLDLNLYELNDILKNIKLYKEYVEYAELYNYHFPLDDINNIFKKFSKDNIRDKDIYMYIITNNYKANIRHLEKISRPVEYFY